MAKGASCQRPEKSDAKDMASCCSDKEMKSCCGGKDAKACAKADKETTGCCKDSCGKDKTAKGLLWQQRVWERLLLVLEI